ncbi:riboflavin synthase [Flindersiella endophytica]
MFTGIVEERGEVLDLRVLDPSQESAPESGQRITRLTVRGPVVASDAGHGDSIAVNGCCLTVVDVDPGTGEFTVDVIQETLRRTSLGKVEPGAPVNLERSVKVETRLSGHLVQGHIDGTGMVLERQTDGEEVVIRIGVSTDLARYIAAKGSIAVEGVSLTVVEVQDHPEPSFTIALIPTTLELTTLGDIRPGDAVNLEVDVIAKYVERLLRHDLAHDVRHDLGQETKA